MVCTVLTDDQCFILLAGEVGPDIDVLESGRRLALWCHHAFVTLFARHEFRYHGTVLLVDRRLVVVDTSSLHAVLIGLRASLDGLDIGQLDWLYASCSALLIVWADDPLHSMRRQHRVVQVYSALRRLTLPFVFVIVDAVNIDNPFVC